jgi:hypothetical protein
MTLEEALEEIQRLKDKCDKQANILAKLFPEKSGHYFICEDSNDKDSLGLPEYIHICPSYGLDGFAIYKKYIPYSAPEW